jgi:hypothetical protein
LIAALSKVVEVVSTRALRGEKFSGADIPSLSHQGKLFLSNLGFSKGYVAKDSEFSVVAYARYRACRCRFFSLDSGVGLHKELLT